VDGEAQEGRWLAHGNGWRRWNDGRWQELMGAGEGREKLRGKVAWVEPRMGVPFIGVLGGRQGEGATSVLMAAIEGAGVDGSHSRCQLQMVRKTRKGRRWGIQLQEGKEGGGRAVPFGVPRRWPGCSSVAAASEKWAVAAVAAQGRK
jgi:hypothetical protein